MNFKKGIVYIFVANVINLLVSLFAGFVLPKMLSVETFSDIKLFQLYITYLGILHLGFSDGMYLRHGGKTAETVDKKDVNAEFKTFKIFQVVISVLAIVAALIIQNQILLFCALVILPVNVGNYLRSLYQATGEFKKYSRFTNISTLLIFVINVILLFIVKSDDPTVYIVAYVVAYFAYWLFLEHENKKIFGKESGRPNKKYLTSNIRTGFFLMTGNFCNVIFTSIDRLFVQFLMGKIEFAMYSFAVGIENLLNVFITPISTVLYNYLCNDRRVATVRKLKKAILLFGASLLILVYPAKFVVEQWISNYEGALNILFLLFAAQFVSILVRCVHINLYKSEKKQNQYFLIMLIIVGISALLDFVFYQIFGTMEAIAVATIIANLIWFVVGEIDLKKYVLGIREYVYMVVILGTFMATMLIENAIIEMVVYVVVLCVATILLLPDTFGFVLGEGKKIKKKLLRKK